MRYFSRCLREVSMQAYSQDLRERVLRALDRGDRPTEIARRFEVSRIWVYQVRDRARSNPDRVATSTGRTRRSDQDRRALAPVEQMESHLQKKRCTPASKNARTSRRRARHGLKRSRAWMLKSSYLSMKRGHRPV